MMVGARVEVALSRVLAFLCGHHSLLLGCDHPALPVGQLEWPVWLGKDQLWPKA
jgi:hypothetical protein